LDEEMRLLNMNVCANIGVLPLPVIATAVLILSTLVLATQASRDDDAVEVFLREFIAMDDATSPEIDLPASFPGNDVENYLELSADPCTEPSMQFDGVDYFGNDLRTGIGSADSAACCRACAADVRCKAWTYGTDVSKCWLKTASSAVQKKMNRKSGVMAPPAVPATAAQTTGKPTAAQLYFPIPAPSSGGSRGLDVALYMYISTNGGKVDVATVTSCDILRLVAPNRTYTQLFNGPVGFISSTQTAIADRPLYAYWSAGRQEMDTNTNAPAAKDGYAAGILLGYVASRPFSGEAPGSAPLFGYWNSKLVDNLCGPFSSDNDVNRVIPGQTGWTQYPASVKPTLLGWMAQADCEVCATSAARTFGNAGGPGCPTICPGDRSFRGLIWNLADERDAGMKPFYAVVNKATSMLRAYGSIAVTAQPKFHMALSYFCCLNRTEHEIINNATKDNCGKGWPTLDVLFGFATYEYNKPDRFSVCAELAPADQAKVQAMQKDLETCIMQRGVANPLMIPRSFQWPIHVTIGEVTAVNTFAGAVAVAEVNKLDWASARAIITTPPVCTGKGC
jgi:hypothetical protein